MLKVERVGRDTTGVIEKRKVMFTKYKVLFKSKNLRSILLNFKKFGLQYDFQIQRGMLEIRFVVIYCWMDDSNERTTHDCMGKGEGESSSP